MTAAFLVLAIAVLPSDRMAMADRLFNKGNYKDAEVEYRALKGESTIAADELAFRLAECDRIAGRNEAARDGYAEVFTTFPGSRFAEQSRFLHAMSFTGVERHRLLAGLDSDRVSKKIRIAALYHLGTETEDKDKLSRCVALDPKSDYADKANYRYARLLGASKDPAERERGLEVLLGIAFGKTSLSEEALYLAAIETYSINRYSDASGLFRRYIKMYPNGTSAEDARTMAAWSDLATGHYADAAAWCGEGKTDDRAYIKAACAYATGDNENALKLFKKYLEDFPQGRYRANAELPVARIEFELAQAAADTAKTIESAKRGFTLSKLATDQLRLAWAYEKAGKSAEAAEEYAKIAEAYPGSDDAAEALYRKAMIDARMENWSATELALSEAIASGKLGKRKAESLYWHGMAAIRLGYEEKGVKSLEQAVAAGLALDENREARLRIADCDYRAGRTEKATAAYRELVKDGACERMMSAQILQVGRLIGGAEAEICAKALTASDAAEWRQAGWALLGECEERRSAFAAAIESYRKCLEEPIKSEELAAAALRLGRLEFRNGEFDAAEKTLKRAVALNSGDARARAEAYVTLAKNAGAKGDWKTAVAYATVVVSLFDEAEFRTEAERIIKEHPEADK